MAASLATFKIAVVGPSSVGKSALIQFLVQQKFIPDFDPLSEEIYNTIIDVNGEQCKIEVLDTAGDTLKTSSLENISPKVVTALKETHGFLLVYSTTSDNSFMRIGTLKENVCRMKGAPIVPMVVVGTKTDLVDDRLVQDYEGKDQASTWNCPFVETSSKDGKNVKQAFVAIIQQIKKLRNPSASKSDGCIVV